jgi:multidrug transporter EmrE-like cation transporter
MSSFCYGIQLAVIETVGDALLKFAAITASAWKWPALVAGMLVYNALAFYLFVSLQQERLSILNSSWDATSHVLNILVGVGVFRERFSLRETVGLLLLAPGIALTNSGR